MIRVKNLTKKYGSNIAVHDLSFDIEDGKIYGFLGPNGAGKSTTMNIITGCLAADEGAVEVDGVDTFEDPKSAKRLIGYLPEIPPLYGELTPYEYLCFVARAKGEKGEALEHDVKEAMEKTRITDVSDRLIRNLSKGYRQRVGIAQAMLGSPKFIILDEPTVGLDPLQIIEIRTLIRELASEHTVILSSHILAEVQEVCDELLIIANGTIAASGTIDEITDRLGGQSTLSVTAKNEGKLDGVFDGIDAIETIDCEPDEQTQTVRYTVSFTKGADVREAVYRSFVAHGGVILEMFAKIPNLEDIFLRLTEGEPTEDCADGLAPSAKEAAELLTLNADEPAAGDETEESAESCAAADEDKLDDDHDGYTPQFK